jgi:polar amino acid transport system substrate-binding protein
MFNARAKPGRLILYCLLAALACFGVIRAAWAEPRQLTLLMGEALDEHGKQKPLNERNRQLLGFLERELDIVFDIRMYPWMRAERNAMQGAGLIFGLSKTPERLRRLRFSDIVAANKLWLVTRSDKKFDYHSIEDLAGKTVGAVRGYSYGEPFDSARDVVFRVEGDLSSRELRLKRLLLGRVDVVLLYQPHTEGPAEIEARLNAFMDPHRAGLNVPAGVSISVLPTPMQIDHQLYFAVAKDKDDGTIDRINAALARQRKSASLKTERAH